MSCNVSRNLSQNGVEIKFPSKPSDEIISKLKSNGFRWARSGHWYTTYSESKHKFALQLCGDGNIEAELGGIHDTIDPNARVRKITLAVCDDKMRFPVNILKLEVEQGKLLVCEYKQYNLNNGDYGGWQYKNENDKAWRDAKPSDVPQRANTDRESRYSSDTDWLQLQKDGTITFKTLQFKYKTDVEGWEYDVEKVQKEAKAQKEAAYRAKFMYNKEAYFVPLNKAAIDGGFELTNPLNDSEKVKLKNGDPILTSNRGFSMLGEVANFDTYRMVTKSYSLFSSEQPKETVSEERAQFNIKYPNGFIDSVWYVVHPPKGFIDDGITFLKIPKTLRDARSFKEYMLPFEFWDKIIDTVNIIDNQKGNASRAKKRDNIAQYQANVKKYEAQLQEMKAVFLEWEHDNMDLTRRFTSESVEEQMYRRLVWEVNPTDETKQKIVNLKTTIDAGVRTMTLKTAPSVLPVVKVEEPKQATPSVEKGEFTKSEKPGINTPQIEVGATYLWTASFNTTVVSKLIRIDKMEDSEDGFFVHFSYLDHVGKHKLSKEKFQEQIDKGDIVKLKREVPTKGKKLIFIKNYGDKFYKGNDCEFEQLREQGYFSIRAYNRIFNISADYFGYDVEYIKKVFVDQAVEQQEASNDTPSVSEQIAPEPKQFPKHGDAIKPNTKIKLGKYNFYETDEVEFREIDMYGRFRVGKYGYSDTFSPETFGYTTEEAIAERNRLLEIKQIELRKAEEAKQEAERIKREDKTRALKDLMEFVNDKLPIDLKQAVFQVWNDQTKAKEESDKILSTIGEKEYGDYISGKRDKVYVSERVKLLLNDYQMYLSNPDFQKNVNNAIFELLTQEYALTASLYEKDNQPESDPSVVDIEPNLQEWLTDEQKEWIRELVLDGYNINKQSDKVFVLKKEGVRRLDLAPQFVITHIEKSTEPISDHYKQQISFTALLEITNTEKSPSSVPYYFSFVNKDKTDTKRFQTLQEATEWYDEKFGNNEGEFTDIAVNESRQKNAKRAYERNKDIERILKERGSNPNDYSGELKTYIAEWSGYGGLDKFGATGKGILYEYFTPKTVIQKMWALALHHGFRGGNVCEPAAGVGDFLKLAPKTDLQIHFTAIELSEISSQIMRILYPLATVETQYFEQMFIVDNNSVRGKFEPTYDLVIGNPPYGSIRGKSGSRYLEMGERSYTKATAYDEYFISRGLDLLRPNGLLVFIIGSEVANGGVPFLQRGWTPAKRLIAEKSRFLDAYRLPNGIFDRTDVLSDIIVLQKI